ncbi:type II toxin-antitoxin system PemK/MazF family toxin [Puniceicoccus vermicola]|uniref:Type II toxin-antitoxin system PemK/MazF family toxin n=1 Tax=Puniceicoccus vermicola TaxID=388746 RepID=A0A7X1B209_9BACT|nr:type II toxin-antitoxin system PemK/MazF family toxin [Puniceicoccus vermicola]MBC2604180.1 type II toxin-antitoxin system PemK/MazF family toxin [Puniceicoccus vermicola]
MISTQIRRQIEDLEIVLRSSDPAFSATGLKKDSLIRSSRIAIVDEAIFEGKIGSNPQELFAAVRTKLAGWIAPG